MDPMSREPEEYGHDLRGGAERTDENADQLRLQRDELPTSLGHIKGAGGTTTPAPVRTVQLVSGDFLLTVNPVDGSEIEPCPPGRSTAKPARRSPADRADLRRAGRP
ncbi:hypothetical protein QR77_28520, partial [Streptomyces sp. 150FB]